MSKERELLQRVVENFAYVQDMHLIVAIQKLLNQPEQSRFKEREVLGKIISADDACNWNLTVGALKDCDHVYVNGVRYVEFQPEPLSDEDVLKIATKVCLEDMGIEMNPKDFKGTGVFELSRAIEKAHGIGVDDEH
jgi:hypothetical protein